MGRIDRGGGVGSEPARSPPGALRTSHKGAGRTVGRRTLTRRCNQEFAANYGEPHPAHCAVIAAFDYHALWPVKGNESQLEGILADLWMIYLAV